MSEDGFEVIRSATRIEAVQLDPRVVKTWPHPPGPVDQPEVRAATLVAGHPMRGTWSELPEALDGQLRALLLGPTLFPRDEEGRPTYPMKPCGGFRPGVAYRFHSPGPTGNERTLDVLICFRCGELGATEVSRGAESDPSRLPNHAGMGEASEGLVRLSARAFPADAALAGRVARYEQAERTSKRRHRLRSELKRRLPSEIDRIVRASKGAGLSRKELSILKRAFARTFTPEERVILAMRWNGLDPDGQISAALRGGLIEVSPEALRTGMERARAFPEGALGVARHHFQGELPLLPADVRQSLVIPLAKHFLTEADGDESSDEVLLALLEAEEDPSPLLWSILRDDLGAPLHVSASLAPVRARASLRATVLAVLAARREDRALDAIHAEPVTSPEAELRLRVGRARAMRRPDLLGAEPFHSPSMLVRVLAQGLTEIRPDARNVERMIEGQARNSEQAQDRPDHKERIRRTENFLRRLAASSLEATPGARSEQQLRAWWWAEGEPAWRAGWESQRVHGPAGETIKPGADAAAAELERRAILAVLPEHARGPFAQLETEARRGALTRARIDAALSFMFPRSAREDVFTVALQLLGSMRTSGTHPTALGVARAILSSRGPDDWVSCNSLSDRHASLTGEHVCRIGGARLAFYGAPSEQDPEPDERELDEQEVWVEVALWTGTPQEQAAALDWLGRQGGRGVEETLREMAGGSRWEPACLQEAATPEPSTSLTARLWLAVRGESVGATAPGTEPCSEVEREGRVLFRILEQGQLPSALSGQAARSEVLRRVRLTALGRLATARARWTLETLSGPPDGDGHQPARP